MTSMAKQSKGQESDGAEAAAPDGHGPAPLVCVVDADEKTRKRLKSILKTIGVVVAVFSSAEDFLRSALHDRARCIVAEIQLPGISGIELQKRLRDIGAECPVILVSHDGSVSTAVNAMQVGAFDYVQKPYRNHVILNMVTHALKMTRGAGHQQ